MGGIEHLAEAISADLKARLPGQRKTQREKLALLVATMLDVRSANLMDLAASLPRAAEQLVMRYQWIKRLLANDLVDSDAVMAPYGREVLARIAAGGETLVLMIDQTQATELHQAVMVAVRVGGRALPLAWRVKETQGAIGFAEQRQALEAVAAILPEATKPVLMGDRFYGSPDLIAWCRQRGWQWRLRLKQDLLVFEDGRRRRFIGRSITACDGASRPCSPTSRPGASASRTAISVSPNASTTSSSSWPSPSTGPSRPACGMPSTGPHPSKKSPAPQAPKSCQSPHFLLHERHPAIPTVPSMALADPTALECLAKLTRGEVQQAVYPSAGLGLVIIGEIISEWY